MTIRKGEPWGESVMAPDGLTLATDDLSASRLVALQSTADGALVPIGLTGGDMARTIGGGTLGRFDAAVVRAPVDLLQVLLDGEEHWALAHVVAHRPRRSGSWWRGDVVLAMNAQFLGEYDVAPRSHPNDGRVDVLQVDQAMGMRARMQARTRARTGSHLPHPRLSLRSVGEWSATFDRPLRIWIDGEPRGEARRLDITVVPDALTVFA